MSWEPGEPYIDIVCTEPGPEQKFVEVEDDEGRSIKIGEWIKRDDGFWALRIDWKEIGELYNELP